MAQTFKSFAALAAHVNAQERADTIRKAEALRKSRALANRKPGTGPRVAK